MVDPVELHPRAFADHLQRLGRSRAYAISDPSSTAIEVSDPALAGLANFLRASPDFNGHEAVFLGVGRKSGTLFGAFVHDTHRGQAQGGLRFWPYPTLAAFLSDGLRLAQGMTRKNALAGIWWGGGKGLIARDTDAPHRDPAYRSVVYREYAAFCTSLRGVYLTAEDAGTGPSDMAEVFTGTRFVTCIPPTVGGSGNPSPATAKGVVCAMEGALDHLGLGTLAGKKIVLQGTGNVGSAMIEELIARDVRAIIGSDINTERLAALRERYQRCETSVELRQSAPGDNSILREPCDILAPNALGGVLNPQTIPTIGAALICGAANNQLLDAARDGRALRARGIVYVPDFLANRMGIVSCANEQYGSVDNDPAIERHFGREWDNAVFNVTKRTLAFADDKGITTAAAATHLADELARAEHPIWGHRGRAIIRSLVASRWHERE